MGKEKVKCTLVQALRLCTGLTAHRGSSGIALLHDHGTRRGWGVSVTPRPHFTPGKTRYPLYRRLGGLRDQSGQVRKISPPPGFDPRSVQPIASRYTDCAILANGVMWEWVVKTMSWLLYPWERDPVTVVQVVGWAPEPVWKCAEERISCPHQVWNLKTPSSLQFTILAMLSRSHLN